MKRELSQKEMFMITAKIQERQLQPINPPSVEDLQNQKNINLIFKIDGTYYEIALNPKTMTSQNAWEISLEEKNGVKIDPVTGKTLPWDKSTRPFRNTVIDGDDVTNLMIDLSKAETIDDIINML